MNDIQKSRPNEWLYTNLDSMKPFINNLKIPRIQIKREKKKIEAENYSSSFPEVVFDKTSGKYLVVGGYTSYYAYFDRGNPNILIPCKAFYKSTEDECYLLTLDWIFKNNVSDWNNRHEIIIELMENFKYTKAELAVFLNKGKNTIQYYLYPPSEVKSVTILQEKERIINKISLEAFKNNHNKDYLYILILYLDLNITGEQLKYISWMRGNGIKFEERELTLDQEHQLIDKALHLKDNFLNETRMMINDMRISNGGNPIF